MIIRFLRTPVGLSLVAALFVIGAATYLKLSGTEIGPKTPALAIEKAIETSLEKDSDEDGLKDWEETLYKTDSADPDTDNDGTSDGEEARLGRNPLISGTEAPAGADQATTTDFAYTATDRFSQEIFKEYIAAKQQGKEITSDLTARIAETVLSQDYSDFKPYYSAQDVLVRGDESTASLRSYGNSLGNVLSMPPAGTETELEIFQKLGVASVEEYTDELGALKKRYETMLSRILAIPAPKNVASAHANFANAVSVFIDSIDGALALDEDPIGSLVKIGRYTDGINLLDSAILGVHKAFIDKNVVFSPTESGYLLAQ